MTAVLPTRCTPVDMRSVPNQFRKIVRHARKNGWVIGKDGHGHVNLVGPSGARVVLPAGEAHGHSRLNALAALRRAGVPGAA